ncbi:MAG: apolipoprotein N-acyltransferase [Candidatus Omnitrophica bacterium]|nr:apolipoprotein N-acyltransferase [Candidatus Omnitrophota bacterium]
MLILALIGSALMFYLAFPNIVTLQGFSLGGWLFAIPLLFVIDHAPIGKRLLFGFVCGIFSYACLVHWLMPISIGGYVLFVLILSLQPAMFALLGGVPGMTGGWKLLYYPSLWVMSEAVRAYVMGGFTWSVAYSQAFHPLLIQGASWGGTAAVSWIMIFVNTAIFLWIKEGVRKRSYVFVCLCVFLMNAVFGLTMLNRKGTESNPVCVHAIQPNISREDKLSEALYHQNISRHLALTRQSMAVSKPDLVIWPETSFPDDVLTDPVWRHGMEQGARDLRVHMLIGSALLQQGKDRNSALLLSRQGEWTGIYHKRKLVPFSEYQPSDYISKQIISGLGRRGYNFQAGERPGIFLMERTLKGSRYDELFGVAICSEEAYPGLSSDLARRGAGFLVVMLNDGWFKFPQALMMHAQMGIFRAVETMRPLVRVSNTGWSVAVDAVGQRVATSEVGLERAGFLSAQLVPGREISIYVKYGDFFTILCSGFVIMTFIVAFIRQREEIWHG